MRPRSKAVPAISKMIITRLLDNPTDTSAWVRRHATKLATASCSKPILDVACGSGRNAFVLTQLGCDVLGIDIDTSKAATSERFRVRRMDVDTESWPFGEREFGGIIQVHFLRPALFPVFAFSLVPGAYLLIETVPGHGGNYLELPRAGELNEQLSPDFELEAYVERKAGPREIDAVTVRVLGRRKHFY
jgi:SAM-dependent methyltransferase